MEMFAVLSLVFSVILLICAAVLFVLWILLPFAVFGIKDRLNDANINLNNIDVRLTQITTLLEHMTRMIDPDGTRYQQSVEHEELAAQNMTIQEKEALETRRKIEAFNRDQGGGLQLISITETGVNKADWFIEFDQGNGTFMKKLGDEINGWKITTLTKSRVTLSKNGTDIELE
jgi:hypothetical protein